MFVDGARPDAEIPGDLLGLFVGRHARQTGALPRREGGNSGACHPFMPHDERAER